MSRIRLDYKVNYIALKIIPYSDLKNDTYI
jgi:hypothetical protein